MNASALLVTGGAGFIGTNFVRAAVARGEQVVVVDRLNYAAAGKSRHRTSSAS